MAFFISNFTFAKDEIFTYRANEIKVHHSLVAKLIYDSLQVEEKEYQLISESYYKVDDFIFCQKETNYLCSVYLKESAPWSLSSFERDKDYGMSDIIDAIYEKELTSKGSVEIFKDKIEFVVKGNIADCLAGLILSSSKKELDKNKKSQISCDVAKNLCRLSFPLRPKQTREEDIEQY